VRFYGDVAIVRVHALAKDLGVESKVVLAKLKEMGAFMKSASSELDPSLVQQFLHTYGDELRAGAARWGVAPVSEVGDPLSGAARSETRTGRPLVRICQACGSVVGVEQRCHCMRCENAGRCTN
jgi:hypothetical protein